MSKNISPMIFYPVILGMIGALVGFVISATVFYHVLVIPSCAVIGILIGMLLGDKARRSSKG